MLPGWCCIANRHIGARERRQLIPHVRFQVPFLGPESQLKSGFACAGLLCSAVSVAGGWWVAAVGFVVVLQQYRSCGSWPCPGGLVSGWTWCWGRIWGTLRVGSEVSKSCD